MSLDTEVDLGTGDVVVTGDSALPNKEHGTRTFQPMSIVAKTAEHL